MACWIRSEAHLLHSPETGCTQNKISTRLRIRYFLFLFLSLSHTHTHTHTLSYCLFLTYTDIGNVGKVAYANSTRNVNLKSKLQYLKSLAQAATDIQTNENYGPSTWDISHSLSPRDANDLAQCRAALQYVHYVWHSEPRTDV
jgi:hypothetical protein